MRLSYPTNIRIIKVPCTGRVAIIHLLKAFEKGADGVFVAGCLEGDCHYQSGNLRAKKRVAYARRSWPASASIRSAWRCITSRQGWAPALRRLPGR